MDKNSNSPLPELFVGKSLSQFIKESDPYRKINHYITNWPPIENGGSTLVFRLFVENLELDAELLAMITHYDSSNPDER